MGENRPSWTRKPVNNYDWASVDGAGTTRESNWSATDGSSVCPNGFRVPSVAELRAETLDNGVTNRDTAFTNFLKLPSAGGRYYDYSVFLNAVGSWGYVWTSSVSGSDSLAVCFYSSSAVSRYDLRASGLSVRCLRD